MRTILLAAALAPPPSLVLAQAVPADDEVTKIDTAQGEITMQHGPIKNLDMDSMTMVFRVADPAVTRIRKKQMPRQSVMSAPRWRRTIIRAVPVSTEEDA